MNNTTNPEDNDPLPENYNEYLEWTKEEEEAFLNILNQQKDNKLTKDEL